MCLEMVTDWAQVLVLLLTSSLVLGGSKIKDGGSRRWRGLRVVFLGALRSMPEGSCLVCDTGGGGWEVMLWTSVRLPASPLPTFSCSFFSPEKQGSCPQVNTDFPQLGLCQDQCQVDSHCPGLLKCCYNGCGKVSCVTPIF